MIKCLANRSLKFSNGNEIIVAKIGFNELPNWVGETEYFQLAVKGKHLTPFDGTSDKQTEEAVKEQEKLAALKDEIKALEEQKEKFGTLQKDVEELEAKKATLVEEVQNAVDKKPQK